MSKSKSTMLKDFEKCFLAYQKNEARENDDDIIWEFMHLITVNVKFSKKWMKLSEPQKLLIKDLRDNSPIQQETLLRIITKFLEDENLEKIESGGKGQVWYLFANAVASYSSYNRYYWISKGAMEVLVKKGIDTSSPVTRSKIFQIRDGDGKKVLTFEHMCPATQLIKFLIDEKNEPIYKNPKKNLFERVKEIMENYGLVAIITKKEDNKLIGKWKSEVDVKHDSTPIKQMRYRYKQANITLEEKIIPVYGKMYR